MFNFLRFAQEYRIDYITSGNKHCTHGWLQLHCPRCGDGSRGYHLGFNLARGGFHCWKCGGVRLYDAIELLSRCSPDEVKGIFARFSDGYSETAPPPPRHKPRKRNKSLAAPEGAGKLKPIHWKYLTEGRGFTRKRAESIAEDWELLGTCHLSGKWNWRIISPIRNKDEKTVAYVGRSLDPKSELKYKVTEDELCLEEPRSFLYGIDKVPGDSVIVVEGPGDAWNVGHGAVATQGIDWTPQKANKIRQFKRRAIMYDPEPKAQERAQELAEWLSYFPGETEIIDDLPSDPGSLSEKRIKKLRRLLLGDD